MALTWVIQKLDEHDKLLQDMFELLRELKQQTDLNNQRFILDVIHQYTVDEKNYAPEDADD